MPAKVHIAQVNSKIYLFNWKLALKKEPLYRGSFCYIVTQFDLILFEFKAFMSQQSVEKKSVPWLLMGLGLLIPFLIIGILFFAAKSDAENKKQYEQQRIEMEKRIAEKEAVNSEKK